MHEQELDFLKETSIFLSKKLDNILESIMRIRKETT